MRHGRVFKIYIHGSRIGSLVSLSTLQTLKSHKKLAATVSDSAERILQDDGSVLYEKPG
jgi:hypothetical protein